MKKFAWTYLEEILVGSIFALMIIVVLAGIFARYVIRAPIFFGDELARYLLVWLTFFGAALALKKAEHIYIEIIMNLLGRRTRTVLTVFNIAIVIVTLLVMLVYGILLTKSGYLFRASAMPIQVAYLYIALPISSMLMLIRTIQWVPEMIKKGKASK